MKQNWSENPLFKAKQSHRTGQLRETALVAHQFFFFFNADYRLFKSWYDFCSLSPQPYLGDMEVDHPFCALSLEDTHKFHVGF